MVPVDYTHYTPKHSTTNPLISTLVVKSPIFSGKSMLNPELSMKAPVCLPSNPRLCRQLSREVLLSGVSWGVGDLKISLVLDVGNGWKWGNGMMLN